MNISLRAATPADANEVADVYLASRKIFVAFAPLAHDDADVRQWIAGLLIPSHAVTVALNGEQIVGMMATSRDNECGWIEQLYIAPGFVGNGIGSLLLERAKTELGAPIRLYTFQANADARRFYEQHGFVAIAFSDGNDNEENCPDVLYNWAITT